MVCNTTAQNLLSFLSPKYLFIAYTMTSRCSFSSGKNEKKSIEKILSPWQRTILLLNNRVKVQGHAYFLFHMELQFTCNLRALRIYCLMMNKIFIICMLQFDSLFFVYCEYHSIYCNVNVINFSF